MEALYAITLGAAFTLKLDGEIGSLETGKKADCCILEDDPLDINIETFKDQKIKGVIKGGSTFLVKDEKN